MTVRGPTLAKPALLQTLPPQWGATHALLALMLPGRPCRLPLPSSVSSLQHRHPQGQFRGHPLTVPWLYPGPPGSLLSWWALAGGGYSSALGLAHTHTGPGFCPCGAGRGCTLFSQALRLQGSWDCLENLLTPCRHWLPACRAGSHGSTGCFHSSETFPPLLLCPLG